MTFILLLFSFSLHAQSTGGWIGGNLRFGLDERITTDPNIPEDIRSSSIGIVASPYWLKQMSEHSAWGIAMIITIGRSESNNGGIENASRSFTFGPNIFWRFKVYQPEKSGLQLGLQPSLLATYGIRERVEDNQVDRSDQTITLAGLISPYLSFPFSDRFRGIIRTNGLELTYSFFNPGPNIEQGLTTSNLSLDLNPSTWTFGFEWKIGGGN
ncbi:MAG: hypothetical protein AAF741_17135 [Bacteroidota bacterium]